MKALWSLIALAAGSISTPAWGQAVAIDNQTTDGTSSIGRLQIYTTTSVGAVGQISILQSRLQFGSAGYFRLPNYASDPSGPLAGDLYYDTASARLRVYTTAWNTLALEGGSAYVQASPSAAQSYTANTGAFRLDRNSVTSTGGTFYGGQVSLQAGNATAAGQVDDRALYGRAYGTSAVAGGLTRNFGVFGEANGAAPSSGTTVNIGVWGSASTTEGSARYGAAGWFSVDETSATGTASALLVERTTPTDASIAAGIGVSIGFRVESLAAGDTGFGLETIETGRISSILTTVTGGSEASALTFETLSGGSLSKRMDISAAGTVTPGTALQDFGSASFRWDVFGGSGDFSGALYVTAGSAQYGTQSLNASATGAAVYGLTQSTSAGTTGWSSSGGGYGVLGSSNGYGWQTGVFGWNSGSANNSAGVVGSYLNGAEGSGTWGALGYKDGSGSTWAGLFSGNVKTTGYLLVGSPSAPTVSTSGFIDRIYDDLTTTTDPSWTVTGCGAGTWAWDATNGWFEWNASAAFSRKELTTYWYWISPGYQTVQLYVDVPRWNTEDNFDGVFVEYQTPGGTWTKITSFSSGTGYPDSAAGSNTACTGNDSQTCWNAGAGGSFTATSASITGAGGSFIRFRFTGFEDTSAGNYADDEFRITNLRVLADPTPVVSSFAAGSLYVQDHVYAHSNAHIGDVAEFMAVAGESEPGDVLVLMSDKSGNLEISRKAMDSQAIGVRSTNPSVTLNNPNEGVPVALSGRVPVKVCAEGGPIRIGDFLTSSSVPGTAMKAVGRCYAIGRALEDFNGKEPGKILCMVQPGWIGSGGSATGLQGGSFAIEKGGNRIEVSDASIQAESRIFLSPTANPGGGIWIDKVESGRFGIRLAQAAPSRVTGWYWIENAATIAREEKTVEPPAKEGVLIQPRRADPRDNNPPTAPPDPNKRWTWSAEFGFKEIPGEIPKIKNPHAIEKLPKPEEKKP